MSSIQITSAEADALECSALLHAFLEFLESCPPFPGPWSRITPTTACRQTVAEPECFVRQMREALANASGSLIVSPNRQFEDVLRSLNILVGAPGEEPRLNPKLCGVGRYVFAVHDPSGEHVVDLVTPLGLLSGRRCSAYTVLMPFWNERLLDRASVIGTTSTREAALLLSVGFPAVLMRHVRRSSPLDYRNFWQPAWSAVPGCRALLDTSASRIRNSYACAIGAASSSATQPEPAANPDADHDDGHTAGAARSASATSDTVEAAPTSQAVAGDAKVALGQQPPLADVAAEARQRVEWLGETPGTIVLGRRLAAGEPLYNLECVMGSSLIGFLATVSNQVGRTYEDLQDGMRRYQSENSLPLLVQLEPSDLEILADILVREQSQEEQLEEFLEELDELLLVCSKRPELILPWLTENAEPVPLQTVAEARQALLVTLEEATPTTQKQLAHDQFAEAVDREIVQPLRDRAAAESRNFNHSVHMQYAEVVRNVTIIEPYAVLGRVPGNLKIDVAFDRSNPQVAHAKLQQHLLEVSKLVYNLSRRR